MIKHGQLQNDVTNCKVVKYAKVCHYAKVW